MSEAGLRINENLDFDTVLQGVLESALSLTYARYGMITLLGTSGQLGDFVTSGLTPEELRELWDLPDGTIRRADGREISLAESPLAQVLSAGETVRAEEIVIQVPDGRSVNTLVNAKPIYSQEKSELESIVVTVQDMTALEELERLRAEFLGIVGHELRTPLTSITGSAATLLDAASSLDPAEMLQFHRIINEQADYMRALISDLIDVVRV